MALPYAEPYKMKVVEHIKMSTPEEREEWIKNAHYNLFSLRSDFVYIDLLTDSGTGSMSTQQCAALVTGDESYAGSKSYHRLENQIKKLFKFPYVIPTHQGRAAENVLFSATVQKNDIIPGNSHFDTTKGHIELRHAHVVDCNIMEAKNTQLELAFKGNIDCERLERVLKSNPGKVPFICLTITNNRAGGQPVSMKNIHDVSVIAKKYSIRVLFDAARFAENAYFIKIREEGYAERTIRDIVAEMFSYADMMTMSGKKNGGVNIGGFCAMHCAQLYRASSVFCILYEGYITYGGMSGRDMNALAVGLHENTEFEQLDARIKQVAYLGQKLDEYNIPYQRPAGGHAIFIDAGKFLAHVPREQFVAQTLAIKLYLEGGIRGVEIGTLLADRDPQTGENRYPDVEFLRLAIPCQVYSDRHMDYVASALNNIFKRCNSITEGYSITEEAQILRHFTVKLEPANNQKTEQT
ncbi:beta-eliminating lyase [[Emmonsia] crescens]|uniref:Beta-eliminating lyase n=1 Tax=[Emmonsia] crescens TaxID=73230 RepID=A0A0G2HRS4_9EURO|nr:beta-eliminating lyase [Emmonsia crescens UAMH 3008]